MSIAAYGWYGVAAADNNKVVNNVITDNEDYGVFIGAFGPTDSSYSASANKVIRNTFSGNIEDIEDGGTATKNRANT